ncbi:portal protein [Streptomyces phage Mischief19]|nr:portal protein [Streptomyces phage Mischief19]
MGAIKTITAAAARLINPKGKSSKGSGKGNAGLQSLAWDLYDEVPEVGTYSDYVSNVMSGAQLIAGKRGPDGDIEPLPDNHRASELVRSIAGGPDGQAVLLGDFGTQLAVVGEGWLIIKPDPAAETFAGDKWYVLSTDEVKVQRGGLKATIDGEDVEVPAYDEDETPPDDAPVAVRVWKAHPRYHDQATSPVLRSLTILQELRLLNAAVAAIARSRLTGRGLLLVPAGARFPTQPGTDSQEDSLLDTFIEVASTAMREPESAAATVPIVLELPADMIAATKLITFDSAFDAVAIQLRDEAIRRFATGADVPAEVLLGLGDSNHWSAWALTAEALRTGAEPRLGLVCNALTTEWLRPILESEGEADADEILVWFDTASLRTASNKAASALEAFKEGLISPAAARRELGFTEADAPTAQDEETAPVDSGEQPTDEGDLNVSETTAPPANPDETDLTAATARATSLSLLPSAAVLDDYTAGTSAALAEAVDGVVWSALAIASRKLANTPIVPRPDRTAARELFATAAVHTVHRVATRDDVDRYRLLTDAWVRVPQIAERYGVDGTKLTAALDDYATALLITGRAHEFDNVPRLLAQVAVAA